MIHKWKRAALDNDDGIKSGAELAETTALKKRIRELEQENLRAIAPRRFKPATTDSKHDLRVSPNLLQNGMNAPLGKGEVIVGDITYLPLKGGSFCYLACF